MEQMLTVSETAKLAEVRQDRVLYWIHTGKLKAINVGETFRPRYRISPKALDDFLHGRKGTSGDSSKRRSRKELMEGVEEIF